MQTTTHNTKLPKNTYPKLSGLAHDYARELGDIAKKASYTKPESALSIIRDTKYQNALTKALAPFKNVKHVILVGIGGSSLGTEAVYHALSTPKSPRLTVLDSISDEALTDLSAELKTARTAKEIAIVIVSKSGGTMETLSNASGAIEIAQKRFGAKALKQVICIGDDATAFSEYARLNKFLFLPIPHVIGGRFSVFSAVGIVPLHLLRLDVAALRKGALDALLSKNLEASAEQAALIAQYAETGMHTFDFFTFNKRLTKIGFWYRQLLAESIGKSTNLRGAPFTHAIIPTVSSAVDLHSMAQLYLSGERGILTRFLYAQESATRKIPFTPLLSHVPAVKGHTYQELQQAIMKGVHKAYDEQHLPYLNTQLKKVDAYEIGFLLSSLMSEVMCLAHVLDVNAFDQPNVEAYKRHTATELT